MCVLGYAIHAVLCITTRDAPDLDQDLDPAGSKHIRIRQNLYYTRKFILTAVQRHQLVNRKPTCKFLLVINSNVGCIFYRVKDIDA